MFDSDFMEFFSRVHPSIPLILYLPVVGFMLYVALWRQGFPVFVVVGFFLLGILLWTLHRISDPPVHFPLRTENARGKTAPLRHSRRASRLSKRCKKTCYAAECQCAARISFLRHVPANLRALCVQCVCRVGVWLCLLRHAALCDAPFSDETRRITLAEAVSSSPSLQR